MRHVQSEQGFTLPELLLAIIIGAIILGAITEALIVGLRTTDSIGTTFTNSHDAQLLSSWLQPDVISAGPPTGVIDDTAVDSGCTSTPPGTTNVVRFRWKDQDSGTVYNAAYRSNGTQLVRYYCTVPGAITSTITVLHNLASATWNTSTNTMSVTVNADNTKYDFAYSATPRYGVAVAATTTTAPTTTTSTSTTSTTSTTTSTTAPECVYVNGSASPSPDARKSVGTLTSDVTVSVTTSGSCSAIRVNFTTHTGGTTQSLNLSRSGSTWTGTITKNAYSDWTTGSHPLSVIGTTSTPTIPFTVS